MNHDAPEVSKNQARSSVIEMEVIGFALAVAACWVTELFDQHFNFLQVAIETLVIGFIGWLVILKISGLIKKIKYLEGFLVMCSECKQVKTREEWHPIEYLLIEKSDLHISHGFCPSCAHKLYSDYLAESYAKEISSNEVELESQSSPF